MENYEHTREGFKMLNKNRPVQPASKKKTHHPILVFFAVFVLVFIGLGTGIEVSAQVDTSYLELYDDDPVTLELNPVAQNIYYSEEYPEFLFQADDPRLTTIYGGSDTGEKNLQYAEGGADATKVTYGMANSTLNMTAYGTDAASGYSNGYLYITPTTDNGLLETGGVYMWAKVRVWDTSNWYLNMTYRDLGETPDEITGVGIDDGDIVQITTSSGTVSTTTVLASITAGSWYIIKFSFVATAIETWVYDEAMTELAHSASGTGTLSFGSADQVRLEWAGNYTSTVTPYGECDWWYTTDTTDTTPTVGRRTAADQTESYQPIASANYDRNQVSWSYNSMGITNDSNSAEARNFLDHSLTFDSATSRKSVNDTQLWDAWSVTPETEKGGATTNEQHLYATVISDPRGEFESKLQSYLVTKDDLDYTPYLIDYQITDLDANITLGTGILDQMEAFWREQAPEILAEQGATVELEDGTTVTPDSETISTTAWTHWMFGATLGFAEEARPAAIKSVAFDDQDQFQKAMYSLVEEARQSFLGGFVFFEGDWGDLFTTKDLGSDVAMIHTDINGMTQVQCGWFGDNWNKVKEWGGGVKKAAGKKLNGYKVGLTSWVQSKGAAAKDGIKTTMGKLNPLNSLGKLTENPFGLASFLPLTKVSKNYAIIGLGIVIVVAIVAGFFLLTSPGKNAASAIASRIPGRS